MKSLLFYHFIPFIEVGKAIEIPKTLIKTEGIKNQKHIYQNNYLPLKWKDSIKKINSTKPENNYLPSLCLEQQLLINNTLFLTKENFDSNTIRTSIYLMCDLLRNNKKGIYDTS